LAITRRSRDEKKLPSSQSFTHKMAPKTSWQTYGTKLRTKSEKKTFLKSVNIWQSYKQERGCLMHVLRLLAVCWPGAQSA